jgi:hypothetical protein
MLDARIKLCDQYPKALRGKPGTITGEDGSYWLIRFDGTKHSELVHKLFVVIVPDESKAQSKPGKKGKRR